MQNGYFKLVNEPEGYGVRLCQPKDGGEQIRIGELLEYLDGLGAGYDRKRLEMILLDEEAEDCVYHLGSDQCPAYPETYHLDTSDDDMAVYVRFFPASETGNRITMNDFLKDLRFSNITHGIRMEMLQDHFQSPGIYCTDMLIAKGKEPRNGTDAVIEYNFNTDKHRPPSQRDRKSVV